MLCRALLLFSLVGCCYSWDNEELELFDIIEEVNTNFYDVFGVTQVRERKGVVNSLRVSDNTSVP